MTLLYVMSQTMMYEKFTCLVIFGPWTHICSKFYIDFSLPMDSLYLFFEDKKNLYLNAQASNVLVNALTNVVTFSIMFFRSLMSYGQSS
jgi:hypothetical protein